MLTLAPPNAAPAHRLGLDLSQLAAVGHRGGVLRVVGGPGTGKTRVCIEAVADRVREGVAADRCLLLAPTRRAAADLRARVTEQIGQTTTEPLARTHQAFGFAILRQAATLAGEPPPVLLSGPEQDVVLRELLAGHAAGSGNAPRWPERLRAALGTRGFRAELRDLLMRAVERGLEPQSLAELGVRHERPEWVAAAEVLREYDEVTALSRPGAFDPAWVLTAAADLLQDDTEALDRVRERLRVVVVDDAQELTAPAARLLQVLCSPAQELVLVGDPDLSVQGFRGADPGLFMSWPAREQVVLTSAHRRAPELVEVGQRVARRIGVVGTAAHRQVEASAPRPGTVQVRLLGSAAQEAALLATELRRARLLAGVPWAQMAVLVRGRSRASTLRRALSTAGVPVAMPLVQQALRDEPVVQALLTILATSLRLARGEQRPISTEDAADLLTSPIGGIDPVALRRLGRLARREELDGRGTRTSAELLVKCVLDRGYAVSLGTQPADAGRIAAMVTAGVEAAGSSYPDGDAEHVLWQIWSAGGLAEPWRVRALLAGPAGARFDHDLDAVRALFHAAATYCERLPRMGPQGFLEHVRGQDLAADSLLEPAQREQQVELLTPQAAAGRQWRFVVVAGVQEGVWPDLRLRGSLLGSQHLVEVLAGRGGSLRAAQAAVRYDETRQFLSAVSRASERLLVTAVRSEDDQPSVYLDLVDPPPSGDPDADRQLAGLPAAMTLPSLVGELRRAVLDPTRRVRAAAALARLARHGVRGAHPDTWRALQMVSDDRPVRGPGLRMTVSPSRLGTYQDCSLRWLLSFAGGDGPRIGAASIGTLVHEIAADLGDADAEVLRAEVQARWPSLGLPAGWLADRSLEQAQEMVSRLARYAAEATRVGWEPVGRELELDIEVGSARLRGRVDRLERGPHGLRVVDYKTGSSKPSAAELERHPQLGAYQAAVEHGAFGDLGEHPAGAALLQIGKAANKSTTVQQQRPLDEDDDPAWAGRLVTEAARGMSAAGFTATVNSSCRTCPVRTSCPLQPEGQVS